MVEPLAWLLESLNLSKPYLNLSARPLKNTLMNMVKQRWQEKLISFKN